MPDKHEVGGSSPLGPTKQAQLAMQNAKRIMHKVSLVTFLFKESNMLIENRIKENETKQIVVY